MKITIRKIFILFLTSIYGGQTVFAASGEANFWKERQRIQVANLPSSIQSILPPVFSAPSSIESLRQTGVKISPKKQPLVSSKWGRIQEDYRGNSLSENSVPLVLIQDVHMNVEAQHNISQLMSSLIEKDKSKTIRVAVEGAFTPFDFSPFVEFHAPNVVRDVADEFLKKNYLSAAAHMGLTHLEQPLELVGLDDAAHHALNVQAYQQSLSVKAQTQRRLQKTETRLLLNARKELNASLYNFVSLKHSYDNKDLSLGNYIERLETLARLEADVDSPFVIQTFLEAVRLESTLNYKAIESERSRVIERLSRSLTAIETTQLIDLSQRYKEGVIGFGEYHRTLKEICSAHSIDLKKTPHFDDYIRYVLLSDAINPPQLLSAMTAMENKVTASLTRSPLENQILVALQQVSLSKKLVDFSLTSEEWTAYKDLKKQTQSQIQIAHALDLSTFEKFYEEADIRSDRMAENILSPGRKPSILVVGGFHSSSITKVLRSKNIPYLVVAPRLTSTTNESGNEYLSVFAQEKTPLSELFSGEKLFLSPTFGQVGTSAPGTAPITAVFRATVAVLLFLKNKVLPRGIFVQQEAPSVLSVRSPGNSGESIYFSQGTSPSGFVGKENFQVGSTSLTLLVPSGISMPALRSWLSRYRWPLLKLSLGLTGILLLYSFGKIGASDVMFAMFGITILIPDNLRLKPNPNSVDPNQKEQTKIDFLRENISGFTKDLAKNLFQFFLLYREKVKEPIRDLAHLEELLTGTTGGQPATMSKLNWDKIKAVFHFPQSHVDEKPQPVENSTSVLTGPSMNGKTQFLFADFDNPQNYVDLRPQVDKYIESISADPDPLVVLLEASSLVVFELKIGRLFLGRDYQSDPVVLKEVEKLAKIQNDVLLTIENLLNTTDITYEELNQIQIWAANDNSRTNDFKKRAERLLKTILDRNSSRLLTPETYFNALLISRGIAAFTMAQIDHMLKIKKTRAIHFAFDRPSQKADMLFSHVNWVNAFMLDEIKKGNLEQAIQYQLTAFQSMAENIEERNSSVFGIDLPRLAHSHKHILHVRRNVRMALSQIQGDRFHAPIVNHQGTSNLTRSSVDKIDVTKPLTEINPAVRSRILHTHLTYMLEARVPRVAHSVALDNLPTQIVSDIPTRDVAAFFIQAPNLIKNKTSDALIRWLKSINDESVQTHLREFCALTNFDYNRVEALPLNLTPEENHRAQRIVGILEGKTTSWSLLRGGIRSALQFDQFSPAIDDIVHQSKGAFVFLIPVFRLSLPSKYTPALLKDDYQLAQELSNLHISTVHDFSLACEKIEWLIGEGQLTFTRLHRILSRLNQNSNFLSSDPADKIVMDDVKRYQKALHDLTGNEGFILGFIEKAADLEREGYNVQVSHERLSVQSEVAAIQFLTFYREASKLVGEGDLVGYEKAVTKMADLYAQLVKQQFLYTYRQHVTELTQFSGRQVVVLDRNWFSPFESEFRTTPTEIVSVSEEVGRKLPDNQIFDAWPTLAGTPQEKFHQLRDLFYQHAVTMAIFNLNKERLSDREWRRLAMNLLESIPAEQRVEIFAYFKSHPIGEGEVFFTHVIPWLESLHVAAVDGPIDAICAAFQVNRKGEAQSIFKTEARAAGTFTPGAHVVFKPSEYRSTDFELIRSHLDTYFSQLADKSEPVVFPAFQHSFSLNIELFRLTDPSTNLAARKTIQDRINANFKANPALNAQIQSGITSLRRIHDLCKKIQGRDHHWIEINIPEVDRSLAITIRNIWINETFVDIIGYLATKQEQGYRVTIEFAPATVESLWAISNAVSAQLAYKAAIANRDPAGYLKQFRLYTENYRESKRLLASNFHGTVIPSLIAQGKHVVLVADPVMGEHTPVTGANYPATVFDPLVATPFAHSKSEMMLRSQDPIPPYSAGDIETQKIMFLLFLDFLRADKNVSYDRFYPVMEKIINKVVGPAGAHFLSKGFDFPFKQDEDAEVQLIYQFVGWLNGLNDPEITKWVAEITPLCKFELSELPPVRLPAQPPLGGEIAAVPQAATLALSNGATKVAPPVTPATISESPLTQFAVPIQAANSLESMDNIQTQIVQAARLVDGKKYSDAIPLLTMAVTALKNHVDAIRFQLAQSADAAQGEVGALKKSLQSSRSQYLWALNLLAMTQADGAQFRDAMENISLSLRHNREFSADPVYPFNSSDLPARKKEAYAVFVGAQKLPHFKLNDFARAEPVLAFEMACELISDRKIGEAQQILKAIPTASIGGAVAQRLQTSPVPAGVAKLLLSKLPAAEQRRWTGEFRRHLGEEPFLSLFANLPGAYSDNPAMTLASQNNGFPEFPTQSKWALLFVDLTSAQAFKALRQGVENILEELQAKDRSTTIVIDLWDVLYSPSIAMVQSLENYSLEETTLHPDIETAWHDIHRVLVAFENIFPNPNFTWVTFVQLMGRYISGNLKADDFKQTSEMEAAFQYFKLLQERAPSHYAFYWELFSSLSERITSHNEEVFLEHHWPSALSFQRRVMARLYEEKSKKALLDGNENEFALNKAKALDLSTLAAQADSPEQFAALMKSRLEKGTHNYLVLRQLRGETQTVELSDYPSINASSPVQPVSAPSSQWQRGKPLQEQSSPLQDRVHKDAMAVLMEGLLFSAPITIDQREQLISLAGDLPATALSSLLTCLRLKKLPADRKKIMVGFLRQSSVASRQVQQKTSALFKQLNLRDVEYPLIDVVEYAEVLSHYSEASQFCDAKKYPEARQSLNSIPSGKMRDLMAPQIVALNTRILAEETNSLERQINTAISQENVTLAATLLAQARAIPRNGAPTNWPGRLQNLESDARDLEAGLELTHLVEAINGAESLDDIRAAWRHLGGLIAKMPTAQAFGTAKSRLVAKENELVLREADQLQANNDFAGAIQILEVKLRDDNFRSHHSGLRTKLFAVQVSLAQNELKKLDALLASTSFDQARTLVGTLQSSDGNTELSSLISAAIEKINKAQSEHVLATANAQAAAGDLNGAIATLNQQGLNKPALVQFHPQLEARRGELQRQSSASEAESILAQAGTFKESGNYEGALTLLSGAIANPSLAPHVNRFQSLHDEIIALSLDQQIQAIDTQVEQKNFDSAWGLFDVLTINHRASITTGPLANVAKRISEAELSDIRSDLESAEAISALDQLNGRAEQRSSHPAVVQGLASLARAKLLPLKQTLLKQIRNGETTDPREVIAALEGFAHLDLSADLAELREAIRNSESTGELKSIVALRELGQYKKALDVLEALSLERNSQGRTQAPLERVGFMLEQIRIYEGNQQWAMAFNLISQARLGLTKIVAVAESAGKLSLETELQLLEAQAFLETGQLASAVKILTESKNLSSQTLMINPHFQDHVQALILLQKLKSKVGRHAEIENDFKTYAGLDQNLDWLVAKAEYLIQTNRPIAAWQLFKTAPALANQSSIIFLKARIWDMTGKPEEAYKLLSDPKNTAQLLPAFSENVHALITLAQIHANNGAFDIADSILESDLITGIHSEGILLYSQVQLALDQLDLGRDGYNLQAAIHALGLNADPESSEEIFARNLIFQNPKAIPVMARTFKLQNKPFSDFTHFYELVSKQNHGSNYLSAAVKIETARNFIELNEHDAALRLLEVMRIIKEEFKFIPEAYLLISQIRRHKKEYALARNSISNPKDVNSVHPLLIHDVSFQEAVILSLIEEKNYSVAKNKITDAQKLFKENAAALKRMAVLQTRLPQPPAATGNADASTQSGFVLSGWNGVLLHAGTLALLGLGWAAIYWKSPLLSLLSTMMNIDGGTIAVVSATLGLTVLPLLTKGRSQSPLSPEAIARFALHHEHSTAATLRQALLDEAIPHGTFLDVAHLGRTSDGAIDPRELGDMLMGQSLVHDRRATVIPARLNSEGTAHTFWIDARDSQQAIHQIQILMRSYRHQPLAVVLYNEEEHADIEGINAAFKKSIQDNGLRVFRMSALDRVSTLFDQLILTKQNTGGIFEAHTSKWAFHIPKGAPVSTDFFNLDDNSPYVSLRDKIRICLDNIIAGMSIEIKGTLIREWQKMRNVLIQA